MSTASKVAWDDVVLPFQLDRTNIRGRVARLDKTLDQILGQHRYPPIVQSLVAEATLLTALIGQTIKLRWKLSLQIRGEGPVRLIATDYFAPEAAGEPARIRAYASYSDALDPTQSPFSQLGDGLFGIIIHQGEDMQPYQGLTPLAGGALADCASTYFAQSEQLPTRFVLGCAMAEEPDKSPSWRAGGIMVQHLARPGEAAAQSQPAEDGLLRAEDVLDEEAEENWTRTVTLLETTELTELLGPFVGSDELLRRLFHEETPRVFGPQPVRFGCTCTEERLQETIDTYSQSEIEDFQLADGTVEAACQFCGAAYTIRPNI